jgi:hypothetical protein
MTDYTSINNGWVEMYLTALLGDGLSKEYVAGHQAETEEIKALYFFNKMIDDDEERIIVSWRKAQVRLPSRHRCPSDAHTHPRHFRGTNKFCLIFDTRTDFQSVPHGCSQVRTPALLGSLLPLCPPCSIPFGSCYQSCCVNALLSRDGKSRACAAVREPEAVPLVGRTPCEHHHPGTCGNTSLCDQDTP